MANNQRAVRFKNGEKLKWRYGFDVLRSRLEDEAVLGDPDLSRKRCGIVNPDFPYQVGIKIVIPAWNVPAPAEDVPYVGEKEDVNLLAGETTGVGTFHIEYINNT